MKCDAILEIAQKGSNGDTLRTKEALVYGKLLITDNCDLKTRDYFNPNQVYIYNEKEGVDMDCFRQNQKNKFESVHFDKFYDALFNV